MPIFRTYRCDCGHVFKHFHLRSEEAHPDCPNCTVAGEKEVEPGLFAITGTKAKAIDIAQKIAEEDFGLTNMHDNMRPGDVAFMPDQKNRQEIEAQHREIAEIVRQQAADSVVAPEIAQAAAGFWSTPQVTTAEAKAQVAQAAAAQRASGVDPVGMLEKGREKGISTNVRYDVVARAKVKAS